MSSKKTALIGSQVPRIRKEPRYHHSDGKDAVFLAKSYGLVPDPWQELVIESWLGLSAQDLYTADTCGLDVPRQNGKNAVVEIREFYGLVLKGEKILHTAHEVKTARKAFLRLCDFFEDDLRYPELVEMVISIRKTNGQEAIILNNGGAIEFSARSKGANRGFTVDIVICDEAQYLTDEQLDALLFTQASAPLKNPQFIVLGTPPDENTNAEVFTRLRKDALKASDHPKGISWHEWSVDEIGDITDESRWYETNPALGIRMKKSNVQKELRNASPEGFARERLGLWPNEVVNALIRASEWEKLATDDPPTEGKVAFGVKFSPDGTTVSLAACRKPKEGKPHIEVIENRSTSHGVAWLVGWLLDAKDIAALVVVDGLSGSQNLIELLRQGGYSKKAVPDPQTKTVIASSSRFLNAVRECTITHFDQETLNESALNAEKRTIGSRGGFGFGAIGEADVTPLEACALAYWGVMTTKRNPGRKMRVG